MNKQKAIKKIEDVKRELEELQKIIDRPESKRFKPELNEIYSFVNSLGEVMFDMFKDDITDTFRYNQRNMFKTKKQAEEELKRLTILAQYKDLVEESWGDVKIDWTDANQFKMSPSYNYNCNKMYTYKSYICKIKRHNSEYFRTENDLIKAIEIIGKDDFKKYIMEV